ncbi:MAG: class I SAM-dependent methyltransferase [Fimbriimonadaceae bacterium]|nr:class I SAM-dependent methyltransferase [Fimbriimonadaceae bacterium]
MSDPAKEPTWTVYRPLADVLPRKLLDQFTAIPPVSVARSRSYYDSHNDTIVSALGATYQAGLIGKSPDATQTLLNLVKACGVKAGETVLDMGCGTGGPAIALAQAVDGVEVIGLTISSQQAESTKQHVVSTGGSPRVTILMADYHNCPIADESVDRIVFFESLGYAVDIASVLREAYRCLRKGGEVYIKDVVRKPDSLSTAEILELAEFDRLYAQRTPSPEEIAKGLVRAGFTELKFEPLSKVMNVTGFFAAMFDHRSEDGLSEFGRHHYRAFRQLPVTFAHFSARK